jgi:hypothetical protein
MKYNHLLFAIIFTLFSCNEDKTVKTESKTSISISQGSDTTSKSTTTSETTNDKVKNIGDDYCSCFSKAAEGINLAEIKLSEISNSKFQKQMEGFGKSMENCAGTLEAKYGKIDKETQEKVNKYLESNCKVMQDLMQFLNPEK